MTASHMEMIVSQIKGLLRGCTRPFLLSQIGLEYKLDDLNTS
jgi:hypothetical protein